MESFLTVILVIVLVVWLLRRLFPLLLVWMLRRLSRRGGGAFYTHTAGSAGGGWRAEGANQGRSQARNQGRGQAKKEGEVRVEVLDRSERSVSSSVGEYVDYDEASDQ